MISSKELGSFISAAIKANQELHLRISVCDDMLFTAHQKGAGGDITHGVDQIAEDLFVKHLQNFGRIDSEESGSIGKGERVITLDPLDGSDNFLSKFPYYGTSVALEDEHGVQAGIVTNLAEGRIYIKTKDYFQCGRLDTLQMRDVRKNNFAKIGIFERAYRSFENVNKLKTKKIKYRAPGAVALSLSLAREVAFVIMEGELRSYDVKAGLFMCEDLYQHKTNDLTIICHQEKIFNNLKQILIEDKQ